MRFFLVATTVFLAASSALPSALVPDRAALEAPAPSPVLSPAAVDYPRLLETIGERRAGLAVRMASARTATQRNAVLGSARSVVFDAITDEILPAWYGTPWDFNGTTQVPGEGLIACGYLVTTVLRDAGFKVERVRLAQQASEKIVKSLAPEDKVLRFKTSDGAQVIRGVRAGQGDGLYVVGLDYHVGFLVLDGERADLCHSAYVPPAEAVCEPAVDSPGFYSTYYVVGPVLSDARIADWLAGRAIPTRKQ